MLLRNVAVPGSTAAVDIETEGELIKSVVPSGKARSGGIIYGFENVIGFPGLINSHDHLEFSLYQKLGRKKYNDYVEWGDDIHKFYKETIDKVQAVPYELRYSYGLYKNLICGITTVAHHGNGKVLHYDELPDVLTGYNYLHSTRLDRTWKLKLNLLFNGRPFVVHTGEGINEVSAREADSLLKSNYFRKDIIGVHAISVSEDQSRKLKAIVWCPDSNLFLYGKTANISVLKRSTNILFGTDSNVSAGWNIWYHLRLARSLKQLDDTELYKSVTESAAVVWNLRDRGLIEAKKKADLVIASKTGEDNMEGFYSCEPEKIILVIKNGRVVIADAEFAAVHQEIKADDFDRVAINSKVKLVTKGINDLINRVREFLPGHEFPLSIR